MTTAIMQRTLTTDGNNGGNIKSAKNEQLILK